MEARGFPLLQVTELNSDIDGIVCKELHLNILL